MPDDATDVDVTARPEQILLLDLDGTLCLGDDPPLRYAQEIDRVLVDRGLAGPGVYEGVRRFVEASGPDRATVLADAELADAHDAWRAVAALARRHGLGHADTSPAFLASRRALGDGLLDVHADERLLRLLAERPTHVRAILATNSPELGLDAVLERIGAAGLLDDVLTSCRKPRGMPALLEGLLEQMGATAQPWRLCSVGDNWRNDIEPAATRGCRTAYVDRFGRGELAADVRAATVGGLVPGLQAWMAGPAT